MPQDTECRDGNYILSYYIYITYSIICGCSHKEICNPCTKEVSRHCPNSLRNFVFQVLPHNFHIFLCASLQNTLSYIIQPYTSGIRITACIQILHIQTKYTISILYYFLVWRTAFNLIPNHKYHHHGITRGVASFEITCWILHTDKSNWTNIPPGKRAITYNSINWLATFFFIPLRSDK